jgi:exodeoxyribonuclease V alpha subunit
MKRPVDLSPFGTAREAVAGEYASSSGGGQSASETYLWNWYSRIREPLKTLYNVEDGTAMIAWELARWQEGLGLFERQALILMILTALVHLRGGSTRIRLRGTAGRLLRLDLAERLLSEIPPSPHTEGLGPVQAVELIETLIDADRLGAIIGVPGDFKPLIVSGDHLYLQKMLALENRFVEVLCRRLDAEIQVYDQADVEHALRDVLERPAFRNGQAISLTGEQASAVRVAAQNATTIISGGPGTGKTTIVLTILRVLRRLGVACEEIALAAPTGKAADRMGQAIKAGRGEITDPAPADVDLDILAAPRTLHRLLGYSRQTGRFVHHENNRLAERVIIVDEGSMIDLALMERLIRSLRDDSKFILLGDAHQLPSVDAGAVLRDLLDEGSLAIEAPHRPKGIRLTESHRMRREDENGHHILTVAQAINRGERPVLEPNKTSNLVIVERRSVPEIMFQGVEFLASPSGPFVLDEFLDRWHREIIRSRQNLDELVEREYTIANGSFSAPDQDKLRQCFKHWERFRILCFTRISSIAGADRINTALHQRALDERKGTLERDNGFIPGEPVMMQVNDYSRGIFNGDQGLVLNVSERGKSQRMAVFPRLESFAPFDIGSLRSVLVHSYAMTVHKAQGSEFDTVVLVLPDRDFPMNTREILYTAVTRSRRSVVIVGSREILEKGIARAIGRDSGIAEKLRNAVRSSGLHEGAGE